MLRALEIFWLSLCIFTFVAAIAVLKYGANQEAILLSVVAVIAGLKYFQRSRQRKKLKP